MKCVASICDPPLSSCFFFHFIPSLSFSPLCPVSASVPCKERCICFCINRAIGPRIFDFALAPSALSASLFGTCCHGSAGECRCCCALIRQGQSNADDRKVGKCVEIFFIQWIRFLHFNMHIGVLAKKQIICVTAELEPHMDKRNMQGRRVKLLETLKWVQHSWQWRRSVYHWGRARTPAA